MCWIHLDYTGGASSFFNEDGDDVEDDEGDEDLKSDPVYTMDLLVSWPSHM